MAGTPLTTAAYKERVADDHRTPDEAVTNAARHSRQEEAPGTGPTQFAGITTKEEGARRAPTATTSTIQKTYKGGINMPPRKESRRRPDEEHTTQS